MWFEPPAIYGHKHIIARRVKLAWSVLPSSPSLLIPVLGGENGRDNRRAWSEILPGDPKTEWTLSQPFHHQPDFLLFSLPSLTLLFYLLVGWKGFVWVLRPMCRYSLHCNKHSSNDQQAKEAGLNLNSCPWQKWAYWFSMEGLSKILI